MLLPPASTPPYMPYSPVFLSSPLWHVSLSLSPFLETSRNTSPDKISALLLSLSHGPPGSGAHLYLQPLSQCRGSWNVCCQGTSWHHDASTSAPEVCSAALLSQALKARSLQLAPHMGTVATSPGNSEAIQSPSSILTKSSSSSKIWLRWHLPLSARWTLYLPLSWGFKCQQFDQCLHTSCVPHTMPGSVDAKPNETGPCLLRLCTYRGRQSADPPSRIYSGTHMGGNADSRDDVQRAAVTLCFI